ncbi:hypothetical protein SAMN02745181_3356 [Rubritalea squalenifaciens DSM 18772]|uniref:Uncharacterized protein n=1 Tax=Rubritalea squalenifaciens DSM 18772 TaxID=1123071 RepID=A0A1M6QC63_9BACT|nr:hypothetical protein [Rubritalea squalenifaciens]SHK17894.1 hypothetical protein SAMN02745181_3356 [Rubritalea squalenifaciens DSM 18772]
MELSVDTLNISSACGRWADCEETLEQWNEAYRKIETYFLALHIDNKLLLSSLVYKVLGKASTRHEQEPSRLPVELAAEEADRLLVEWFRKVLGDNEEEPIDRLSARGRLALMLLEADTPWQHVFLHDEPVPDDLKKKMQKAYLVANPKFSFTEMYPKPIDLGIVQKASQTLEGIAMRKTAAQWTLWLAFSATILLIFIFTR